MPCLDDNRVTALLAGTLSPAALASVDAHIGGCPDCRELVGAVAAMPRRSSPGSLASRSGGSVGPAPGPSRWLRPGSPVGRYTVETPLGAGAMGVVYAAYDSKLDRKIALKLVRPGAPQGGVGDAMQARLLQEAQAIARVNHPNVVSVFDAGVFEDRVFLAMELVDGSTLLDWMLARGRAPTAKGEAPLAEVLALLVAAGRGLAAAHDAGVVHRDFKPDNVLLGASGQVKVADFGLACAATERALGEEPPGSLVGTPAYMAPEQRAGRPADARSDQYAFCVTLHQALHGVRPGAASARRSRAPAWLRRLVAIGLRADPDERHASVGVLLDAIERGMRRRRQRPWVALGAVVAVTIATLGAHSAHAARAQRAALCTGGDEEVARVWGQPRRDAIAKAFAASELPFAAQTGARVGAVLDQYAAELARGRNETCAATRIQGTQSEAMLDRRMRCFDGLGAELGMLGEQLERPDASIALGAVSAAEGLTPPASCSAARVASEGGDPGAGDAALAASLGAARTAYRLGQYADAKERSEQVVARARAENARTAEAGALLVLGMTAWEERQADRCGSFFFDAYEKAEEIGAAPIAADAAGHLVWVSAQLGRREEAERWLRLGGAAVHRSGGDEELATGLEVSRMMARFKFGEHRQAIAEARRVVDRLEHRPDRSMELVRALRTWSNAHTALGELDDALPPIDRALAIAETELGTQHPRLATLLHDAGTARANLGLLEEAIPLLRRATELYARANPNNPMVPVARATLGQAYAHVGRVGEAREAVDRAIAEGERNPTLSKKYLAQLYAERGDVARLEKRYDFAVEQFKKSAKVFAGAVPPGDRDYSIAPFGLGQIALERGRPAAAIPLLEEALRALDGNGGEVFRAEVRFTLARALVQARKDDGKRAAALALAARAYYRSAPRHEREVRAIDAWLAKQGRSSEAARG